MQTSKDIIINLLNRLKRSEVLQVLPRLLPHDSLVMVSPTPVFRRHDQQIIRSGNHLRLSLHYLLELQLGLPLFVVLAHCEPADLHHVLVPEVLYWPPSTHQRACTEGVGSRQEREEQQDAEEKIRARLSHSNRLRLLRCVLC